MSEDLHDDIDDIFRKGLAGHSDLPDESIWQNIDRSLDKNRVISISRKYRKLKWAAAAVLLFSVGMAMFAIHSNLKRKEAMVELDSIKKHLVTPADSLTAPTKVSEGSNQPGSQLKALPEDTFAKNNLPASQNMVAPASRNAGALAAVHGSTQPGLHSGNEAMEGQESTSQKASRSMVASSVNPGSASSASKTHHQNLMNPTQAGAGQLAGIQNPVKNKRASQLPARKQPAVESNSAASQTGQPQVAGNAQIKSNPAVGEANQVANPPIPGTPLLRDNGLSSYKLLNPPLQGALFAIEPGIARLVPVPVVGPVYGQRLRNARRYPMKWYHPAASKWSLAVFYSPDFVATSLAKETTGYRQEDLNEIRKEEQNRYSYSGGLLAGLQIPPRISLQSGVKILSWQTNIQPKKIYAHEDNGSVRYRFDCVAGYSDLNVKSMPQPTSGDSIEAYHTQNSVEYLGIPLMVSYHMGTGRFNFTPALGFTGNFLVKGQLNTTLAPNTGIQKTTTGVIQGLRSFYLNGLLSLGADYDLNRHLAIAFIPRAEFAVTAINKNAPVKTHIYTFGLGGGLIYKF